MRQFLPVTLLLAFSASQIQARSSWEPNCHIDRDFDGRIPPFVDTGAFDRNETPYAGNRPRDVPWKSILSFPQVTPSLFDVDYGGKAVEILINDLSVLRPSWMGAMKGYRRTDMYFAANNGSDSSVKGVKTFHWSVRQGLPLNMSHEYQNVFQERRDGKGNQFAVSTGTIVGKERMNNARMWKVLDYYQNIIWSTPVLQNKWENFAITLDYGRNTMKVYYSTDQNRLQPVTRDVTNKNEMGGLFQFGVLKKSTGAKDALRDGYHETNIHESQIYGGVFIEDSTSGCVSGTGPIFRKRRRLWESVPKSIPGRPQW